MAVRTSVEENEQFPRFGVTIFIFFLSAVAAAAAACRDKVDTNRVGCSSLTPFNFQPTPHCKAIRQRISVVLVHKFTNKSFTFLRTVF